MMSFERTSQSTSAFDEANLGDLIMLQRGFDITKAEQASGRVPIVSSSGVSSFHNKWRVRAPGVVIGRKGTLGTVHYLAEDFWPHDTTLWVKDFKGSNPRFVSYFLRTLRLENFDTGSSNPTLNRNHVHKIRVQCPNGAQQKKIAAVLSAYDDLIENNRQRIALLERMAEQTYREWFVRFRFPSYEQTKFEKGVPSEWSLRSLSALGTFLNGYAFKPSDWRSSGIPIIKIKEMSSGVSADTPRNPGDAIPAKYCFADGDIIFSWSGTFLALIWDQGPGLLNQHLFKVTPATGIPKSYLYFSIATSIPWFESLATGATMQHIKRKELDQVKVPLPPADLLKKFDVLVSPMLSARTELAKTNRNLMRTRDLLLPRLISGKLRVDNLNIQFPPSMQDAAA